MRKSVVKLNKEKGFTLIELIVAMSIISLISIGFYSLLNTSIKTNVKNEQDISALQLAQSEMENIRLQIKSGSTQFETKDKDNKKVDLKVNGNTPYKKGENNKIYNVEVDINLDSNSDLYKVIITSELENTTVNKKKTKIVTEIFGG